jgi:hypothetical protein
MSRRRESVAARLVSWWSPTDSAVSGESGIVAAPTYNRITHRR